MPFWICDSVVCFCRLVERSECEIDGSSYFSRVPIPNNIITFKTLIISSHLPMYGVSGLYLTCTKAPALFEFFFSPTFSPLRCTYFCSTCFK